MGQLKIMVMLMVFFTLSFKGCPHKSLERVQIDCGSSKEDTGLFPIWSTDKHFANKGMNKIVPSNQTLVQMNTLRYFPEGEKNCYSLPLAAKGALYLFRASFYYGNYDGRSVPPSFQLEIDGNLWADVTTSSSEDEPVYYELLYVLKQERTAVCLVRTTDDIPFISALEGIMSLDDDAKRFLDTKAFYLHNRTNFGSNESIGDPFTLTRVWKGLEMPEYNNIHFQVLLQGCLAFEICYPNAVMQYAMQAKNVTESISFSVDLFANKSVQAYFAFYFLYPIMQDLYGPIQTCTLDIHINNHVLLPIQVDVPVLHWGQVFEDGFRTLFLYPVLVNGSVNVTISSVNGSTIAPFINAMEVYSAIDASAYVSAAADEFRYGNLVRLSALSFSFIFGRLFDVILYVISPFP